METDFLQKENKKTTAATRNSNLPFWEWFKTDKGDLFLAYAAILVPIVLWLLSFISDKLGSVMIEIDYWALIFDIIHILFITWVIIELARITIARNGKEKNKLHNYVRNTFSSNSMLGNFDKDTLSKSCETIFRQFYLAWMFVWVLWFLMYFFSFFSNLSVVTGIEKSINAQNFDRFYEATHIFLNLLNSIAFFYIYFTISASSVKSTMIDKSTSLSRNGLIFIIIFSLIIITAEAFTCHLHAPLYYYFQFGIKLSVAIFATIALVAVIGKLNSSFLKIPTFIVFCLFFMPLFKWFILFYLTIVYLNQLVIKNLLILIVLQLVILKSFIIYMFTPR
ncbi:MAG: hypothetical protein LBP67_00165 [Bacteroidales bacterium]|jgi:hypothetical protein|nr:hypothetical protein [Bacteroidales bacterium]